MKRANNSALVLKYYDEPTAQNIRKEAAKRGLIVDSNYNVSQLLFMHGAGMEHIQRKAMCDLYLDVHKYNGHSTTADILWVWKEEHWKNGKARSRAFPFFQCFLFPIQF